MNALGWTLLVLAGLIHAWWGAQAKADAGHRVGAFYAWGAVPLYVSILMLVSGAGVIWYGSNLGMALVAVFAYFFLLPLVTLPLLRVLRFAAPSARRDYASERRDREYERIISQTPEEKLFLMPAVRETEKTYFTCKRDYPDRGESLWFFSALKSRMAERPDEEVWTTVPGCATLDDILVAAVRFEFGANMAEAMRTALAARRMCVNCGRYRALLGSVCYGCLASLHHGPKGSG